ncbi:MAG TPA: hypothetical protein ACFCUY_19230 [Xenococcaceae cyanobacterium]
MKKLLYLSIIGLSFATQGIVVAQSTEGMDNEDFTQLVCGYVKGADDTQSAVNEAYSVIESLVSSSQLETLRGLSSGEISADTFCVNFDV